MGVRRLWRLPEKAGSEFEEKGGINSAKRKLDEIVGVTLLGTIGERESYKVNTRRNDGNPRVRIVGGVTT